MSIIKLTICKNVLEYLEKEEIIFSIEDNHVVLHKKNLNRESIFKLLECSLNSIEQNVKSQLISHFLGNNK